jgi:hypothetical protein
MKENPDAVNYPKPVVRDDLEFDHFEVWVGHWENPEIITPAGKHDFFQAKEILQNYRSKGKKASLVIVSRRTVITYETDHVEI